MLLFGEHTVLQGGSAYAVPLRGYRAELSRSSPGTTAPGGLDFGTWLEHMRREPGLVEQLDLDRLASEADRLRIESNIPVGYGLGSSGALCALVYGRYARRRWTFEEPRRALGGLRTALASLENFFHGSSSGLDPLTSFLNRGVVIEPGGGIDLGATDSPLPYPHVDSGWFLLDSGQARRGELAIRSFRESAADPTWRTEALAPMHAAVERIVEGIRTASFGSLPQNIKRLSELQLNYLPAELIPTSTRRLWGRWLAEDLAYLKLCGAGAGGFYLGYAPRRVALENANLRWI